MIFCYFWSVELGSNFYNPKRQEVRLSYGGGEQTGAYSSHSFSLVRNQCIDRSKNRNVIEVNWVIKVSTKNIRRTTQSVQVN